jgi:hypothetical protein
MEYLNYIIEHEHFIACPLLPTDQFVKYCSERGIKTSREQLEQLEKLGLFYPLARVRHPQTSFWFRDDHAKILFDEGQIWDPSLRAFEPWDTFRDEKKKRQVENFYSVFQVYPLHELLNATKLGEIRAERWALYSNEDIDQLVERIRKLTQEVIAQNKVSNRIGSTLAALVCQIISNRYFFETQSDRRTIRISQGLTKGEWDWFDYRRTWDAKSVAADLGIEIKVLERICYMAKADANAVDPMERWSELVSFISLDKRKQLKGAAQLADTLRCMGTMLNRFYEDLTGEGVHLFDESPEDMDSLYGGEGVTQDNLEYLEYLANEYHLNPRPKLILVVEGSGEEEQFPRLAEEVFGISFPKAEIEVRNLNGIGNFTGDKKKDKYGALEKFIDFNHDRQTIVFVVLDDEGGAVAVKQKLINKDSEYHKKRKVTRDEYISIWNGSIEFANFSNGEIADALTEMCEKEYTFQPSEIEPLRKITKGNPLKDFFNQRTEGKYDLKKRELLKRLCDPIVSASKAEFEEKKMGEKPLIRVLNKVLRLANRNFQPQSREAWTENQDTGLFGHVSGKEEKRTKEYLSKI